MEIGAMSAYDIMRIMQQAEAEAGVKWDVVGGLVAGLLIGAVAGYIYHLYRHTNGDRSKAP